MIPKLCKLCGRLVSTTTRHCPNCGALLRPLLSTQTTIVLLYVGAAALLVVLCYLVAVDPRL